MTVLPAETTLTGWHGGTFRTTFTLHQGPSANDPVRNLTGWTGQMVLRPSGGQTMTLNEGNGGIIIGGADGTITVLLTDDQTLAARWSTAKFLLTITSPSSETEPLLHGTFRLNS